MDDRTFWKKRLGKFSPWSTELRVADPALVRDAAHELEELGFRAAWIPGLGGGPTFHDAERLIAATETLAVVIGVQSIWKQEAVELAASVNAIEQRFPGRLLTGLGISAAETARAVGKPFVSPVKEMTGYLDGLDSATSGIPQRQRMLGSLGPKMSALAAARTAGLHPYLIPPEANASYRALLGNEALLAPQLTVVLDTDPSRARDTARRDISFFLGLPAYQGNLRRLGFGDDDFVLGGSDRLIDALVAWGDLDAIHAHIQAHLDAGADHVALQVVTPTEGVPLSEWRELAALLSSGR